MKCWDLGSCKKQVHCNSICNHENTFLHRSMFMFYSSIIHETASWSRILERSQNRRKNTGYKIIPLWLKRQKHTSRILKDEMSCSVCDVSLGLWLVKKTTTFFRFCLQQSQKVKASLTVKRENRQCDKLYIILSCTHKG